MKYEATATAQFTQVDLDNLSVMFADLQAVVDRLNIPPCKDGCDSYYAMGRIYGVQEAVVGLRNFMKIRVANAASDPKFDGE